MRFLFPACLAFLVTQPSPPAGSEPIPIHHPEALRQYELLNRRWDGREEPLQVREVEIQPYLSAGDTLIHFHDRHGISPHPIDLPYAARGLLSLLDGTRTRAEVLRSLGETHRKAAQVDRWLRTLDEGLFLEDGRFRRYLVATMGDFRSSPIRSPICAGTVYSANPDTLRAWLSEQLSNAGVPFNAQQIVGLIAPHIDYGRGASVYRKAYGALLGQSGVSRVVVLGTAHMPSCRPVGFTRKTYVTPLGRCDTDTAFLDRVLARYPYPPYEDEFLHRGEHSIELQLPYLQAVFGPNVTIVPVLCGSLYTFIQSGQHPIETPAVRDFCNALREAVEASPGRTLVVAAADLAHMGPQFGDRFLMEEKVLTRVGGEDRQMLEYVVGGDADRFFQDLVIDQDSRRICGSGPIYLLLKILRPKPGTLLAYHQCTNESRTCTVTIPAVVYNR